MYTSCQYHSKYVTIYLISHSTMLACFVSIYHFLRPVSLSLLSLIFSLSCTYFSPFLCSSLSNFLYSVTMCTTPTPTAYYRVTSRAGKYNCDVIILWADLTSFSLKTITLRSQVHNVPINTYPKRADRSVIDKYWIY